MPNRKKPTTLKLLKGTLKPSREKPPIPKSTGFRKHPPRRLTSEQQRAWREIVKVAPAGLLAPSDVFLVELCATLLAEYRAAPAAMPAARLSQLQGCMKSLGLNPQTRQTLNIAEPDNEFDEF